MLASEATMLRQRYPSLKFLNDHYNRVAIQLLHHARLILKFDAGTGLPDWLPDELKKLVNRQPNLSIWIPDIRIDSVADFESEPVRDFLRESLEDIRKGLEVEMG